MLTVHLYKGRIQHSFLWRLTKHYSNTVHAGATPCPTTAGCSDCAHPPDHFVFTLSLPGLVPRAKTKACTDRLDLVSSAIDGVVAQKYGADIYATVHQEIVPKRNLLNPEIHFYISICVYMKQIKYNKFISVV